jgi:hypothetical protein
VEDREAKALEEKAGKEVMLEALDRRMCLQTALSNFSR